MMDPSELIERASRFIAQQRELYGDFEVQTDLTASSQSPEPMESKDAPSADTQKTPKATEPKKELSIEDKLKRCSTLDELHALCKESEALHTDLEGTNLVFGVGHPNAELMIVGEAPGYNEDQQGEPFVGQAGQLLDKIMEAIQFKREELYIANILKHRPPNNRDPKPEERTRSLPFLLRQIELIDPKLILCVGRISACTLLGKEDTLKNMRQQFHPFHGREMMVTYHPAALLRNPQWKRPTWEDVQLLRKRYDELVSN